MMADGNFDALNAQDPVHATEPKAKSIWFIDNDDSYGLYPDEEYMHEKTGAILRLVRGVSPVKWDDVNDRILPASEHDMDGFRRVVVEDEHGTQFDVLPGLLIGSVTSSDFLHKPPMGFLSYDDMLNMPEPEWLIDGVIQKQTSALIFGASNSFKSFLGIDMMMSVATGKDWQGCKTGEPLPCVYVATEGSNGVAGQRIPGWVQHYGMDTASRLNFFVCPDEIALDDEASVKAFLDTCAYWKDVRTIKSGDRVFRKGECKDAAALVVIDIFGASMLGSESSDETARAWVKAVNRIMREMNCAVLTIAHSGWMDATRARMHSHFWGSFDTRFKAEGDKDSLTSVLTLDRHKDADSSGEWGFRLEKVDAPKGTTTLIPGLCDDVQKAQKRRISGKPAIALQALSEAVIEHGRTIAGPNYPACPVVSLDQWKGMCGRHGLTDSENPEALKKALQRAKSALLDKGLIRQFDDHVWKVSADD